ncbi:head-tail connector protein [Pseudochrobactrum sp. HB0163]|uniref:head-tail connector protein n=1 Tax=Pseudochrobactrum sp. HB0163 TaxID=3450708 RepID=UPI003F6DA6A1
MVLRLVTPPAKEPVTTAMLRSFLRLPPDQEEDLLVRLIRTAREVIEQQCNLAILPQSWHLHLANWPQSGRIALYKMPVISLDKVQGFSADGSAILFGEEDWRLDAESRPQRLYLRKPPLVAIARGVEITLTAGLADEPEDLPETLRHACVMLAAHLYDNRNSADNGTLMTSLPDMVAQLVALWLRRGRL